MALKTLPGISRHVLIRYVERVMKVNTARIRKRIRKTIRWIDHHVDQCGTVAEVDYYLALKRSKIDEEMVRGLMDKGIDLEAVRQEILAVCAKIDDPTLRVIRNRVPITVKISGLELKFDEGRLVTLVAHRGRAPRRKSQRRAELREMARRAEELFEDALVI